MRVLFVAHAFPRHERDLPGNFVLRLAAALAGEGVQVTALAPAAAGLAGHEELLGVTVRRYRFARSACPEPAPQGLWTVRGGRVTSRIPSGHDLRIQRRGRT